jgi:trk system potassium uptake protein TrkH
VSLRPGVVDLRLIGLFLGRGITAVGVLMLIPAVLAALYREWNALTALTIGATLAIATGRFAEVTCHTRRPPAWAHGMVTVGVAWLVVPLFTAVPLYLSGHTAVFLDAYFEAISGVTTTGLTMVQDLDHLAISINLYRHLLHFIGGQAAIVVILTLFTVSGLQGGALYLGETRDDRILPNFVRTARFVGTVALTFLVVGTTALTIAGVVAGLSPVRSLTHAVALFLAAFDTGGFSLQSTSVAYYHSVAVEALVIVLMLAGALSYGLHFQLWRGNRRELLRNIETRTMAITLLLLVAGVYIGLGRSGAFTDVGTMFRRGFFTIVSTHTTTGLTITDPRVIVTDWGLLAPAALVTAMAVGGMASSTAGGIKAIRVGIVLKGVFREVRRVLLPESAVVVASYHQNRRHILRDVHVRSAATILLLFLTTFLAGGLVTLFAGESTNFTEALFESTAATSTVGMSVGVATPAAPAALKVLFIVQMWLGRLEFMAAFAAIGYVLTVVKGRT